MNKKSSENSNPNLLSQFNWFDGQRIAFIVAFLCGGLGTVYLKEQGIPAIFSILLFLVVVLAYIIYCSFSKTAISPEILGDNIYYLGFLLTLVSLAYTLYKFTSADNEIDEIIQNFGIALSSTLIGVIGRVYFNQTREDELDTGPVTVDQSLEEELALREVMLTQAKALASESTQLSATLTQSTQQIHEQVAATAHALEQLVSSVRASTQNLVQSLEESTDVYKQFHEKNTHLHQETISSLDAINQLKNSLRPFTDQSEASNKESDRGSK
jgi:hypothetical protein